MNSHDEIWVELDKGDRVASNFFGQALNV